MDGLDPLWSLDICSGNPNGIAIISARWDDSAACPTLAAFLVKRLDICWRGV